jgi:hypothetical protein
MIGGAKVAQHAQRLTLTMAAGRKGISNNIPYTDDAWNADRVVTSAAD